MLNSDKDILWNSFYEEWGEQYEKAKIHLDTINNYPKSLHQIIRIEFLTSENHEETYKNWLKIRSELTNEKDIQFFKSYWMPLSTTDFDTFIDLSSPEFPIISCKYFVNMFWYKINITEKIQELLKSLEEGEESVRFILLRSQFDNEKMVEKLIEEYLT
jgi:hypothetical protein